MLSKNGRVIYNVIFVLHLLLILLTNPCNSCLSLLLNLHFLYKSFDAPLKAATQYVLIKRSNYMPDIQDYSEEDKHPRISLENVG